MTIHLRSGGTYKQANNIFVKDAGEWKQANEVWIKDAGTWKRSHLRVVNLDIAANTESYNVMAATIAAGWNGIDPVTANVRISSGVVVSSANSLTGFAIDTGSGWPAASDIRIFNNGTIIGQGGSGGTGGNANQNNRGFPGVPGAQGGTAIFARHSTSIYNSAVV